MVAILEDGGGSSFLFSERDDALGFSSSKHNHHHIIQETQEAMALKNKKTVNGEAEAEAKTMVPSLHPIDVENYDASPNIIPMVAGFTN
ncbi:hypothetical protein Tco_1272104 [Tanacetum coccineum]